MSAKDAFGETAKTFVRECSFHLSQKLSEKGYEITPEEICECFDMKMVRGTPTLNGASVQTQMPTMPNYFSPSGVSPAKKRSGRTKKVVDTDLPICEYKMTRGKNPGKQCPRHVLGDGSLGADRFCKDCLKKAAVKAVLEDPSSKTTVQAPSLPGSTVQVERDQDSKKEELSVIAIPGKDNLFREVNHGFIVQSQEDGSILALSIEENGKNREMREDEKTLALSLGLQVASSEAFIPDVPQVSI